MRYHLPSDLIIYNTTHQRSEYWSLPKRVWVKINSRVTGKGIVIANLDTGINLSHPLLPKPIASRSFVKNERDIIDYHGHGSHTIGTCCGRDSSISPAFEASLIVAKVLGRDGAGEDSSIASAIKWVVDEGVNIINMSLGGNTYSPIIHDAVKYAESKRVLVVAAAGNDGFRGRNTIGYPARLQETLCVGAYRSDGQIASFSSGGREIDIATPGEDITSCSHRGSQLALMSGTSMAAPFATALCTLVLELLLKTGAALPTSYQWWRDFFSKNCYDSGPAGKDQQFGFGIPIYTGIVDKLYNESLI